MIINNNSLLLRLDLPIQPDDHQDHDEEEDVEDDYDVDVMITIPGGNVGSNHLIKSSNCSKVGALNSSTGM